MAQVPLGNSKAEMCAMGETCFLLHIDMLHEVRADTFCCCGCDEGGNCLNGATWPREYSATPLSAHELHSTFMIAQSRVAVGAFISDHTHARTHCNHVVITL